MRGDADLHNFGRAVLRQDRGGVAFYQKPRTVFWEWLFFGIDSPLSDLLSPSLRVSVLGLSLLRDSSELGGLSREIVSATSAMSEAGVARAFGALLAYCYTLGITDLHNGNIVFDGRKFQVIDAEIVLTKLILPDETLLLPFKQTPYNESGMSLLCPEGDPSPAMIRELLDGFVRSLSALSEKAEALECAISRELAARQTVPVRVILRNTRSYYRWKRGEESLELMPEERAQLDRGDIPYFFKFVGGNELYWHRDSLATHEIAQVPPEFRESVDRIGRKPAELLNRERIQKQLFAPGLLVLARKLLPENGK